MSDLLAQFLIEARDLIEGAADDLIALERAPDDAAALDRVFRAFHTLKGSVGLFDFPPFLALLHAAEDGFAAARAARRAEDGLVDRALQALDAASRFTEAIAASGALPPGAAREADGLGRLLRGGTEAEAPPDPPDAAVPDWAEALLAGAQPVAPGTGLVALRYRPRADCFFAGDDPIGLVRRVPALLALRLAPAGPWPEEVDVFACNLDIALLSAAPLAEVEAPFRLVRDQTRVAAFPAPAAPALPPLAAAILREQLDLVGAPGEAEGEAGRREAASRSAANALRAAGLAAASLAVLDAAAQGTQALSACLAALLARGVQTTPGGVQTTPGGVQTTPGGVQATPGGVETTPDGPRAAPGAAQAAPGERLLRVEAARIDRLVALAGDLVTARTGLGHLAARAEAGTEAAALARALRETDAQLGRLAGELHRGLAALRLVPLGPLFRRFPRPLREIARSLGKEVVLVQEGEEVAADRALVDALFEPLLHVIRNAVDHGLEEPQVRLAAGKPAAGRITLRAALVGETLAVTVADDGRGIDPERLRRRAAAAGLRAPEALAAMSDAAAIDLVFAPGFSTAERVSDLSGRGVGMDAVRAAAERLGGRVAIESEVGRGTAIRLLLPQRLALTRIVLVGVGPDLYGLPLEAVAEAARVPRAQIRAVGPGRAAVLRGRTVPVVRLASLLGAPGAEASGEARLVVLGSGADALALEVDRFGERLDVLTRPLPALAAAPGLGGTALLGDGRVLLVLDPPALLALALGEGAA
ncbi:CheA signal transduction histidine kinase [Methylobacterium sp. 4-46]|uniref:chemotaxis protein CheA n=1 Tax=unclassified Methylobacterium TaxID=2615210 RepID=UPI000152D3D7|nr:MULTISPECIES: chemotaxis protein CheA [Methylobacterium]ACA16512.1 CheA signal transduction histidine kinase [Methylobacterium sp. 4-46]WFT82221.1 chemotaxis protein CheA [Methylobacterium nodulans]